MATLIITEKPSVAMNIASALGVKEKKDGFFTDNKQYYITFAFGHLLTLFDAKDYDENMGNWELDKFPFIPGKFKYKIINDNGVKKQFKIIKDLVNRSDIDMIYDCGDSDREGTLLMDMLLKATGNKKPVKRLWLTSYTPEDIFKALKNMKDDKEMMPLKNAGYARQHTDWILGVNFTSVATLKFGGGNRDVLNIGRVILPTVKLIYDRDMAIKNFKPIDYFELWATFKTSKGTYKGIYFDNKKICKFKNKNELIPILDAIKNNVGIVVNKSVTKAQRTAPGLFNLSILQGHITSKYNGWDSDKVLKVCQKLYESRYLTYPRTESIALNETQIGEAERTLKTLITGEPYENIVKFHTSKKIFDSSKVDSHPAITPTYIIPQNLSADEQIVYDEVKNRFITQFMPAAEYENTQIITSIQSHLFHTRGRVLISEGWLSLYGKDIAEENTEDEDNQLLPNVSQNATVNVDGQDILSKKTKPPAHFTEKTLLKAMADPSKFSATKDTSDSEDMNIENVLKGYSIGTAATRAETIKKVISVGYISKKGKSLMIAEPGTKLINIFPVKELMDVDYTGKLEMKLKHIEKGEYSPQQFMSEIIEFTKKGVETIKCTDGEVVKSRGTNQSKKFESLGKCACGGDIIENSKGYGCSNWKQGCKFVIWKEFCGKKITRTVAKELIDKGIGKEFKIDMDGKVSFVKGR